MAVACAGGKQRELEGSSEYEAMQIQHSETGGLTAVDLAYTNTRRPTAIAMAPPRSKLDSSDTQQQMPLLYSCSRLRSRHGSFRLTESSSCRGKLRGSELHTQTQRCQRTLERISLSLTRASAAIRERDSQSTRLHIPTQSRGKQVPTGRVDASPASSSTRTAPP